MDDTLGRRHARQMAAPTHPCPADPPPATGRLECPNHPRHGLALQLTREAMAIGHALLGDDILEARFRCYLIAGRAGTEGLTDIARHAAVVHRLLCEDDTYPPPETGAALSALVTSLVSATSS